MALDIELETLRARWDQTEAYVSEVEAEYGPLPGARLSLKITKELIRHADAIKAIIDEALGPCAKACCSGCPHSGHPHAANEDAEPAEFALAAC